MVDMSQLKAGDEVISWCTKCLEMKPHRVKALVPDGIPRVICLCPEESERNFRPNPPKSRMKKQKTIRGTDGINPFRELKEKSDLSTQIPYTIHQIFSEGDVLDHRKYGLGFVLELVDTEKMIVAFEDRKRLMVFNKEQLS